MFHVAPPPVPPYRRRRRDIGNVACRCFTSPLLLCLLIVAAAAILGMWLVDVSRRPSSRASSPHAAAAILGMWLVDVSRRPSSRASSPRRRRDIGNVACRCFTSPLLSCLLTVAAAAILGMWLVDVSRRPSSCASSPSPPPRYWECGL